MEKEELYGEDRLAAETRIRNLLWTVSGDYDLSCELDIDSFQKAKEISLYDAIKQGAFARFFDTEAFGLYLVKKIYLGADEGQLMGIAQLCLDEASFSKVAAERPGVPDIRKKAFEEILERDFGRLNASFAGRLKLAYLRRALTGDPAGEQKIRRELDLVEALKDTKDTLEIIRCVDGIYNSAVDRKFEREHGTLAEVLAVSVADLKKYDWQDYLKEEAEEARLEEYLRQMQKSENGQMMKCNIVLQEMGGKYENQYAAAMLGNMAQCKYAPGELVAVTLRFTTHEHNGQVYQDILVTDIEKVKG